MRLKLTPENAISASAFGNMGRRSFLSALGAAATVPAAALASEKTSRLPSLEDNQLDACVAQLRSILKRMAPGATEIHEPYLEIKQDGGFCFSFQGDSAGCEYSGPGLYEVSEHGFLSEYWLEQDCHRNPRTGEIYPDMIYYRAVLCLDGLPVDVVKKMNSPKIMRKLDIVEDDE